MESGKLEWLLSKKLALVYFLSKVLSFLLSFFPIFFPQNLHMFNKLGAKKALNKIVFVTQLNAFGFLRGKNTALPKWQLQSKIVDLWPAKMLEV